MLGSVHFDLNMLVTLGLLLRTKSVTRTAQHLGVSQPSVSRSLAQLRALLDDPLLVRTAGGMELTRRAEELGPSLQDWLTTTAGLLAPPRFDPAALDRRFRIASTDFGVAAVVAPTLPHIARAAPGAAIDILPLAGDMIARLTAGDIDLLISGLDPDPSLTYDRFLFTETFSCVVNRGHLLAGHPPDRPLPITDFLAWPHISFVVSDSGFDRIHDRMGDLAGQRRVIARLPYFQAAPHLIQESDAIMTLPTRAAQAISRSHDLACFAAPERIGTFGYRLLWNERSRRDPAIAWLCDLFATHCGGAQPMPQHQSHGPPHSRAA